ncbi:MAG: group II intron maturase-specific domain-containing protein [Armatimonadota bacterium]
MGRGMFYAAGAILPHKPGRPARRGVVGVCARSPSPSPQPSPIEGEGINILLEDLDKGLERVGYRLCRYADGCNIYIQSNASGERVMEWLVRVVGRRLKLRVSPAKSAARPWGRKFLGYSMTTRYKPRQKAGPARVRRFEGRLRYISRLSRGGNLRRAIGESNGATVGWVNYLRPAQVKGIFEEPDQWVRRKLRRILWHQWRQARRGAKRMGSLGLEQKRAYGSSAFNGCGPW